MWIVTLYFNLDCKKCHIIYNKVAFPTTHLLVVVIQPTVFLFSFGKIISLCFETLHILKSPKKWCYIEWFRFIFYQICVTIAFAFMKKKLDDKCLGLNADFYIFQTNNINDLWHDEELYAVHFARTPSKKIGVLNKSASRLIYLHVAHVHLSLVNFK